MQSEHGRLLITSVSNKVPLIKTLRKAIEKLNIAIELVGGDINKNCIARYFTDEFWEMPSLNKVAISDLITMLNERRIRFIIPTRDGELEYLSINLDLLKKNGIHVMISNIDSVHLCLDKLIFYEKLKDLGFPTIQTTENISDISSDRFVVKERYGAGAIQMGLGLKKANAIQHSKTLKDPVFQPYIEGQEVSVDAFMDRNHRVKGIVIRTRDLIVNGESQITSTVRDDRLQDLCVHLLESLKLYGHCILQIITDAFGDYHFVECNTRFGGASSLSAEVGLESFYWFLLESIGFSLEHFPFIRSTHEKRQVRYHEDLIL